MLALSFLDNNNSNESVETNIFGANSFEVRL